MAAKTNRKSFPAEAFSSGPAPLDSVLCTGELDRRPARLPDYAAENRALGTLAQALADSPETILQKMAEALLETLHVGSSGFSFLTQEDGGKRFYWPAVAGAWAAHIRGDMPRNFSPAGDVLDRDAPLLFRHPERRYAFFQPVEPTLVECLLVPIYVAGKAVGTVWVAAHDDRRTFDAEDRRQLISLGRFASAAYQAAAFHAKTVAMNEALLLGSLRQHESANIAVNLNAQLREKEWRLRYATDSARLTYIEMDLSRGKSLTAENFAIVMGYAPPPEKESDLAGVSRALFDHVVPHDRLRVQAALDEFIGGQPIGKIDYRVLGDDGVERWIETRWTTELGLDGRPSKSFATNLDVTDRKRAEEGVRASDQRFRAAVSIVSSLVWTNSADGLMEGEQPGWSNFTGQSLEHYRGYGWANAVHPEDASSTIAGWERAVAEKRLFEFEHRVRRRDGEWRLCSVRAVPLFTDDGALCEWVGVHTDITERQQARSVLQESEAFNRSVIETSPDCINVLDHRGNLRSMLTGQNLLGIEDIQPFLNKSWFELWMGKEDWAAARAAVAAAAAGGEGKFVSFFNTLRGEPKWWDISVSPLPQVAGQPAQLLAVSRDVTRRKRAEIDLSFLASISQDLALSTNEKNMVQSVGAKIGAHFNLSACALVEIDEAGDRVTVPYDWHREDVPGLVGVYRQVDFVEKEFTRMARAGEIIVVHDAAADARTNPGKFTALKIASFICAPLIRDGQWRFALCLYHSEVHVWQEAEIELARELTVRLWTRLERLRAVEALRQSEERHRTLFTSMDQGFCVLEMIFDEKQKPVDWRYLEVNPSFEQHTGMHDMNGRLVRDLIPDIEEYWLETYGTVAATGEPVRFVGEAKALGGWFDLYAFRVGGPDSRKVAVLFTNVTERKRREQQAEMLTALSRELAGATEEAEIVKITVEAVGRHLNAHRCYFVECLPDENRLIVSQNWVRDDAPSIAGELSLFDFGGLDWWREFASGDLIIEDVATNPLTQAKAGSYHAVGVPSYAVQPFRRDADWTVCLVATEKSARKWTAHDLHALDDVVVRVWPLVERARANRALRGGEEQLRRALESAELGSWNLEPTTHVLSTDNRFRVIFGVAAGEISFEQAVATVHPDDREGLLNQITAATRLDDPLPCEIEYRVVHPDGSVHWVFGRGRANFEGADAGRKLLSFDGTIADITARKRSETALRESEERYRTLFNSMDEGFCVIEMILDGRARPVDYRFLEVNPSFEKQTGMHGATGKRVRELAPDLEDPWFQIFGKVARTGESARFVKETNSMGGRWFDVYACAVGDRNSRRVALLFTDITAQRRHEAAIRYRAELLGAISNSAAQLLVADSPKFLLDVIFGQLARVLKAEYHLTHLLSDDGTRLTLESSGGLKPDQRTTFAELSFGPTPEVPVALPATARATDLASRCEAHAAAMADALGTRAAVCRPLRMGDRIFGMFVVASAVREPFGEEELRFIYTLCDLVAASLERARLTDAAGLSRDAAEQANVSKDLFLAALSHELRTPLTPVLLLANEALEDPTMPPATREVFATIVKNVALEARLIDDLLDVTRISQGKLLLDLQTVDVHVVLEDAIEMMASEFTAKEIVLTLRLRADRPWMLGDRVRLQQIFWNVLRNAAKFSPREGPILVETSILPNEKMCIKIVDSGIGITEQELGRLFASFAQGDHASEGGSHRFGGLGLGLSISRRLAEMHSGTIRAESGGLNRGATFIIELPLDQKMRLKSSLGPTPAPFPAGAERLAEKPLVPRRVLLVEDHESTRKAMTRLLMSRHYTVVAVGSLAEARAAVDESHFDLLISDLGLPDGTGYELMTEFQTRFGMKGIALSGYGREEDFVRSRAAGFVSHLIKPVSLRLLESALAAVMATE